LERSKENDWVIWSLATCSVGWKSAHSKENRWVTGLALKWLAKKMENLLEHPHYSMPHMKQNQDMTLHWNRRV